jgi:hypothetical protein
MKLCQLELRLFSPGKKVGLAALAGGLISCAAGVVAPGLCATAIDEGQKADQFLVVDCLLPSQVRQLGVNMTYLAPRQAVKTPASDCAIRGGEYVAYDRANYTTALKVWLPRANEGDKVAQTYVGEIYEKGLGTAPDYPAAASWYQKAAAQGYSRALIDLGFLYEQGLGVSKDPAMALKLYRKAAGLEGSIALDAPTPPNQEEVKALREELERTRRELDKARQELDQQRMKSGSEIEHLTQQKLQAAAAGNAGETRRLEALLKQREAELEQRRQQVARLEQTSEDYRARLTRMEGESTTLRQDLEQARLQVAQSQREIEQKRNVAAEAQRKLDAIQREIAQQKQAGAATDQARTKALEAELDKRKDELERQRQEISRLENDARTYKEKVASASQQELKAVRQELERTRKELDKARQELDTERVKSSSEIERLTQQKLQAAAAGNATETRRLETLLKERESELEKRRQQVASLEQTTDDYRTRLTRLEGESASLRQELEQARRQLAQSQREIEDKKNLAAEAERRLESMRKEIAQQKQAGAAGDQARIKALEIELAKRKDDFQLQQQEIARLETDVKSYKAKVAKLEEAPVPATQTVAYAPPTIQIIDPPVVLTRDTATVKVRKGLNARAIVGRVTAPAGLLSFTVNDVVQEVDANGLFNTRVDLGVGKTKVALLAVDRQGKRALTDFILEQEVVDGKPTESARRKPISLDFGKYHALVIGNQKYQKLPSLDTPEIDAKEISDLLKNRYGFTVTTLMNATRYQILSELNKFRAKLNENDNFLIYYAGHGELDRANARGHWLPVDAEPDSDANWISSISVTDILNAMTVKHVLIVADSCYSGAMTRGSIGQLESGMTDDARLNWYKSIAKARSRTALTSGGLKPVLDSGGGKHSVFAQNFINILTENQDILEGQRLYREISARVLNLALKQRFEQRPEYAPLRFAGHESGDFLFVPAN